MIIQIKTRKKLYRKDMVRLFVYNVKEDIYSKILIIIYLVILAVFCLNHFKIIQFYVELINFFCFSIGIGIIGMIIHITVQYALELKRINKNADLLDERIEKIIFEENSISVERNSIKDKYKWESFKYFLMIKDTIFIIPVNKNDNFLRFNKMELLEGDFYSIIAMFKKKWGSERG